jgi:ankyrin repeat protein
MNRAFNHGSQGDLLSTLEAESADKPVSKAPKGTGDQIRAAARDNEESVLNDLLANWKNDPVVNEPDEIGTTPLHTAAAHGNKACVEMLLAAGADKGIKNSYGQTPYAKTKETEIKALLKISGYNNSAESSFWCSVM